MDEYDTSQFNVTITSVGSSFFSSTPKHASSNKRKRLFAMHPSAPVSKRAEGPVIGICLHCSKEYRSEKYFDAHIQGHQMKEAATKYPDEQKLLDAEESIAYKVLSEMQTTSPNGKWGGQCHSIVCSVKEDISPQSIYSFFIHHLHNCFAQHLKSKKFCLPSALYQEIQKLIEIILTDPDFRATYTNKLKMLHPGTDTEVLHSFLVEYAFTLGDQILHFIASSVMEMSNVTVCRNIVIDQEERQLIHYVSGAVIRAFLRKAIQFKKSSWWCAIKEAIVKCILQGDMVVAAADKDIFWTELCNRGALLFVGATFLELMISIVHLLYEVKRPDGSLLHQEVQAKLLDCPARSLWDEMIGTVLSEEQSLNFFRGVVRSFTSSYGRGISKKHVNQNMKTPKTTMSLRKRLGAKPDK